MAEKIILVEELSPEEQHRLEIKEVRAEILKKLHCAVHLTSNYTGTGSGRTRGNPGVRRARVLTAAEVAEENRKRGLRP